MKIDRFGYEYRGEGRINNFLLFVFLLVFVINWNYIDYFGE